MHWYFRNISDDPSEKELTQQDQFNNDDVALSEALVRETIQNSTDAHDDPDKPVHVRFAVSEQDPESRFFQDLVGDLAPHLEACQLKIPSSELNLLVVEDFNTTGLEGQVDEKDEKQFCDFWRRFGRSHKQGAKGGRWGLGKLVFPSASQIRTVIGLTRRKDDDDAWVMGQAILRNHSIEGQERDSVGFWCRRAKKGGLPTNDSGICSALTEAAGLSRRREYGLSLVVPYLLGDIGPSHLIAATIRNYYFPILTGRLVVDVNDTVINSGTFDTIAETLLAGAVPTSMLQFVREIQVLRNQEPHYHLPSEWQTKGLTGELLGPEMATQMRDQYRSGHSVFLRAPLTVAEAGGQLRRTYIDAVLKAARPGERSQTLVVRNAITVPAEGRRLTLPETHAGLIATDGAISQLLGDAENPAHTQWNERAEKLRTGWQRGNSVLRRVRALLPEVHDVIAGQIEREDRFALVDFFAIPRPIRTSSGNRPTPGRPDGLPPGASKAFRILKRKGGFAVVPGPGLQDDQMPIRIRVSPSDASPDRSSVRRTPGASDNTSPRSRRSSGSHRPRSDLAI